MIEKINAFFENELQELAKELASNDPWTTPKEMVDVAVKRMLGVFDFAVNYLDADYDEVEYLFDEYRYKAYKMI